MTFVLKFDQENLQKKIECWKSKCPDVMFCFHPLVKYSEELTTDKGQNSLRADAQGKGDRKWSVCESVSNFVFYNLFWNKVYYIILEVCKIIMQMLCSFPAVVNGARYFHAIHWQCRICALFVMNYSVDQKINT